MKKFKGKYRVSSARLGNWDYRSSACYFVTIRTKNRSFLLGEVQSGEMILNEIGKYANRCLNEISIYNQTVNIVNHVIMPDHVHALINLETHPLKFEFNRFGPLIKGSLSSVINHFKGRVTKYARELGHSWSWQSRFHDHIVRDDQEFLRIFKYITDNPKNWKNKL